MSEAEIFFFDVIWGRIRLSKKHRRINGPRYEVARPARTNIPLGCVI